MEKKKGFIFRIFGKENDEIAKLKSIKKRIGKIKTIEDLEALEDELIEIGLIDEKEMKKIKKLKDKKRRKSEKEMFEERVRCNLEIINRTIAVGKQFKMQERQRKDEERRKNKDERNIVGNAKLKDREEKIR